MKFNITQKLLTLVTLPIVTLIVFSIIQINDRYALITKNSYELSSLKVMKKVNNLIHELQKERGLSANVLSKNVDPYFTQELQKQLHLTDEAIKSFVNTVNVFDKKAISQTTQRYLNDVTRILSELTKIRLLIEQKKISQKKSFNYYTFLNAQLISILNSFKIINSSPKTTSDFFALNQITQLQEYASQERALISKLVYYNALSAKDFRTYHSILTSEEDKDEQMHFILANTKYAQEANKIHEKFKASILEDSRNKILNLEYLITLQNRIYKTIGFGGMLHNITRYQQTKEEKFYTLFLENKSEFDQLITKYLSISKKGSKNFDAAKKLQTHFQKIANTKTIGRDSIDETYTLWSLTQIKKLNINPIEWFNISTQRINAIHEIEGKIFTDIFTAISKEIESTQNELLNQILITIATIMLLILGAVNVSNRIKYSISQLAKGMDNFFGFLNFEHEKPEIINTKSNDEIHLIAEKINFQIEHIETNLEEDLYFIKEITEIVTMMKDGDFSERPYFEPNNPNLRELKLVFNELIELIAQKIKEQTTSLERLNGSLEDKVFTQTLELQKQVDELTVARDKAIQAEVAKDEFLANMSHEIRTPLNAILGFVTILKKRITEEKSLNYLNIIDTSGKSLLTIINDILDFSKIQSGKFTISPHNINPVDEFTNATLLFASKAYEKHLVYAVYIDPNLPSTIRVDEVRVKQILSNLLSNAIKFTPEDGLVKVKIVIQNSKLIISVQDSGIGISKENQSRIFTAFEQADGSTTRKYGGTGLGLSISSKLSVLMDGKLSLSSDLNKGATFTLEVPIEIIQNTAKTYIDKEKIQNLRFAILNKCSDSLMQTKLIKKYLSDFGAENILELNHYQKDGYDMLFFIPDEEYNEDIVFSTTPSIAILRSTFIKLANLEHVEPLYAPFAPKSLIDAIENSGINTIKIQKISVDSDSNKQKIYSGKVLVAEDNKTNQMLIGLLLSDYELEYQIVDNGLEAVQRFKDENFDLVLMDENMPELNGVGAMKQIKEYQISNNLSPTPIVALTASVLDSDKEMFLSAGMDGFVGKPIEKEELEEVLDKYLTQV